MMLNKKYQALVALLLVAAVAVKVLAHGDEDHSESAPVAADKPAPPGIGIGIGQEGPRRLADGSLFVPKSVQRRLGIRTVQVDSVPLAAGEELNGTVVADPETGGRVQAPFAGAIHPGPKGMPVGGRRVSKGEILAYIRPVASAIELGNQRAQVAELDAQLAIADRQVERYLQLAGSVPQKEIDAARIERDALRRRRNLVTASVDGSLPLRAPAAGVVSTTRLLAAGQIVDARELLFDIIDPSRLAIEALSYDPGMAGAIRSATAQAGDGTLTLRFVGGGLQLRGQALPLLFRVTQSDVALAVGQPVKVVVRTQRGIQGAAVPLRSLTRLSSGETAVWVHTEPERFVARSVRTRPLDAANAAVVDGLHDGDRVVTDGSSLLSQVR
jgi:hypothetical protein